MDMTNNIKEIQYNSDGEIEYSYDALSNCKEVLKLKTILYKQFKEKVEEDLSFAHDMISYRPKIYEENSIVVVYSEKCPQYLKDEFKLEEFNSLDYYSIRYCLLSGKRILKTYDCDMYKYEIPTLPPRSAIGNQFGIGRTHSTEEPYRDVYFFNSNDDVMNYYWGDWLLEVKEPFNSPNTKCYGITYNKNTRYMVNKKRYIYPPNLEMKDLSLL